MADEWNASEAGIALLEAVVQAIGDEKLRASRACRVATDADLARAVLRSPALQDANRAVMDSLEAEYKPRIAALVAGEAAGIAAAVAADERERAAAAVLEFARTAPLHWGTYRPDSAASAVLQRMERGLAELAAAIRGAEESGTGDGTAEARRLIAQAEAADTAYRLAAAKVAVYKFLHQHGLSESPGFQVAIDLAVSLRKIIDGTEEGTEQG